MTEQDVQAFGAQALASLLKDYFNLPADKLSPTATIEELGLDSLGLMELVVVLEERTGADLNDRLSDISPSDTLEQVAATIESAVVGSSLGEGLG